MALGQQFYHDSSVEREPEVGVEHVLTLWQRQLPLTFTDGGTERQLDVALLLPFKRELRCEGVVVLKALF